MITAENITDEQIRELRESPSRERHEIDGMLVDRQYIRALCHIATCERDVRARARCAEIINHRQATEGK